MSSVDVRKMYEESMNNLIKQRTKAEMQISSLVYNLYKLPDDLFDRMKPAIAELPADVSARLMTKEEVTLKDFVPTLYDLEHRDRKTHATQIYETNKFIKAWEELRRQNDEEIAKCLLELKDKNL